MSRKLVRSYAISHLPFSYELPEGMIKPFVAGIDDRVGDNIADKKAWSETRAHYWLWKNVKFHNDEFVSLQQYRRCFWFPQLIGKESDAHKVIEGMARALGQQIIHMTRREYVDYATEVQTAPKQGLDYWIGHLDIVVCRPIHYPETIARIYADHHRGEDWEVFAKVCREYGVDDGRHPWLTGHLMFIMRPDIFDEYMTLWWAVMQDVDRVINHEDDPYQHRKIGYLTERFMSAWLIKKRTEEPTLRIQTLPIVEGLFQHDRPSPDVM